MKGIEYGLEAIKKIKKENPKVNIILYGYYKPEKFDVEYEWVQSPVGEKLRETYRKIHIFISLLYKRVVTIRRGKLWLLNVL